MKMNPREQLLAVGVIALLGVMGLGLAYFGFSEGLAFRRRALAAEQSTLKDKKAIVTKGMHAEAKMNAYAQQSLPSNLERAQSLYQKWLLDLVEKHKLSDGNVKAVSGRSSKGIYHQFTFSVKGRAGLAQATRMLHEFYSVDRLHRIRRLRLKPLEDSTDLDVEMLVEVLALEKADAKGELPSAPSKRLQYGKADDYVKTITERNFFGPPHKPPTLANTARSKYELGSSVAFSVKGSDPEKRPITYELEKASFKDFEFDPKTGAFNWKPEELGNYEVTVKAIDGGVPPKSVSQTIKFAVVEKPTPREERVDVETPAPPPFDTAKFTYLTAVIDVDGQPEAWLVVRTTGKTLKLVPGEKFDVTTLKGTITRIGEQEIEIETDKGERLLISVGESLREGLKLPPGDI